MKRLTLGDDTSAVSSAISVILMVAVTVIVTAVVSVFALGLAEGVSNVAPQAAFDFEVDETTGDVIVRQANGESLDGGQLAFSGAALEKTTYGSVTEWAGSDVEIGDSARVNVRGGETLRVTWQSTSSGQTATVGQYDVPDDASPTGSIGSVDTYYTWDEVRITNIQFNRVHNDRVYVVVEDEDGKDGSGVGNGNVTKKQYFSTNGGDLTVPVIGYYIANDETVTVTIYETDSESIPLATATTQA